MQDQQQPFAVFVLDALMRRSTDVGRQWTEHAKLGSIYTGGPGSTESHHTSDLANDLGSVESLVQTLIVAASVASHQSSALAQLGAAIGIEAHRRNASLHLMLEELGFLSSILLRTATDLAREHEIGGTGYEGLTVARRITAATSQLQLAAVRGFTQAITDELRERYRAIRHDLRNPLGTIKSAITLLTDESVPVEMRESRDVRAMVVRNTSSLDQLIGEVLGDTAARLRAFDTPRDIAPENATTERQTDGPADVSPEAAPSAREQRDDVTRAHKRPDLESGTF